MGADRWRQSILGTKDVALDASSPEYRGFVNLGAHAPHTPPNCPPLADLGIWIGEKIFGKLRTVLKNHCDRAGAAVAVNMILPPTAENLLSLPFELAHFANRTSFREAGVRFIYRLDGALSQEQYKEPTDKESAEKGLRILAVFSLPVRANPLNLRRERFELQELVRYLKVNKNLHLRILQYGATRKALEVALQERDGWDIIHFSGHGQRGKLHLVDDCGGDDQIHADELGKLLKPAVARLKLLILNTCYSGASNHASYALLGHDQAPGGQVNDDSEARAELSEAVLPSLAQDLAKQLDCAVLAMRYPVDDAFATELILSLYKKLLEDRRLLPEALHLALNTALPTWIPWMTVLKASSIPVWTREASPILVGARAADLELSPPEKRWQPGMMPDPGPEVAFPSEAQCFVGHLLPMLKASQALALSSKKRGVLFHGEPGVGKTACAVELAYCYDQKRFVDYVLYEVGAEGDEVGDELRNFLRQIELQSGMTQSWLSEGLEDKDRFRRETLPKWRAYLRGRSILLVLDNLDPLMDVHARWIDPLWSDFLDKSLTHGGFARVVLTTRRVPVNLAYHPGLMTVPIDRLNDQESTLLARELLHLKDLFRDDAGLDLLQRLLIAAKGNPEVFNRANKCAADLGMLARLLDAAEHKLKAGVHELDAFPDVCGSPEEKSWRLALAAAATDKSLRSEIDPGLAALEKNGWQLTQPLHRIWAGERDAMALTGGIDDEKSTQLVRRVLRLLDQ